MVREFLLYQCLTETAGSKTARSFLVAFLVVMRICFATGYHQYCWHQALG